MWVRFLRWPEAIPLCDTTTETIAKSLLQHWIARFGTPATITTDRGYQFETYLYSELTRLLGCKRCPITAYRPAANGMVKRFHWQLKSALRVYLNNSNWLECLPLILFGIYSTVKEEIGSTPAEMVYGTILTLPGQMIAPVSSECQDPANYIHRLRDYMSSLPSIASHSQTVTINFPPDIQQWAHVFVWKDTIQPPLQSPYSEPFKVLNRTPKYFILDINGKKKAQLEFKTVTPLPDQKTSPHSSTDNSVSFPVTMKSGR